MFTRQLFQCSNLLRSRLTTTSAVINHLKYVTKPIDTLPKQQMKQFTTSRRLLASNSFECVNIQDSEDFKTKVLNNKTPVIVDFHATWCGPCKLLGPRLESIVSEKKGKVILAKVDIDENSDLAIEYGVKSVPTVISFVNGQQQDSFIGSKEDDQIQSFVDKLA